MKRNYLIIVLSLVLVQTGFAQDKLTDLFSKLEGQEKVTQVTITKSMLSMMPNMIPNIRASGISMNMDGIDVKNVINKLDQIDVFTSEDADIKKMMLKETTEYFNGKSGKAYDVLMRIKDHNSNIVFYGKKDGNFFTSLIMLVTDDGNCTIMRVQGKFTPEDIQDITKANKK